MPTVVFDKKTGVTRERLQEIFKSENIDARVFFYPLSGLPMFDPKEANVNSWSIPTRAINLPSYHDMSQKDIHSVLDCILRQIK
jgi:perosamine synthetase